MTAGADRFDGKTVLVGGATGAVGGTLVATLLQRGARVAAAVRRPRQVHDLTGRFGTAGMLVGCVPARDAEAAAGLVKGATDALGPIDALIGTAGAFAADPLGGEDTGQLERLLEANLLAGVTLARAVVPPMKRRRTGALVFTGSAAVGSGGARMAHYLASKAALHEWVRALAQELAGTGVRVGAVLPTTIDTEANRAAMPDADRSQWQSPAEVVEALLQVALGEPDGSGPLYRLPPRR